jgi:hypothetical protein
VSNKSDAKGKRCVGLGVCLLIGGVFIGLELGGILVVLVGFLRVTKVHAYIYI